MPRPPFWLLLLACAVAPPADAQSDEQAVLAVVKRLFDGMRTRDTGLMRAQMDPTARLIGIDSTGAHALEPGRWIGAVGRMTGEGADERTFDPEVRVDGNIATVWTYYELWRGSTLSHCGIDAFFLVKTLGGWKVSQVADTRRSPCQPHR